MQMQSWAMVRCLPIALAFVMWASAGLPAQAAAVRFGEVVKVTGEVRARNPDTGALRTLAQGDVVLVGERIEAGDTAEAVVRTDDAGVIALRSQAIFTMQGFRADSVRESRVDLRIVRGALRLITGWVGARNPGSYRIHTPTATIGIRGTDQEPYVLPADLARRLGARPGTYNKVNSGGVQMQSAGGSLALGRGQAGFVPAAPTPSTRGLMTALLPVLLEKVPAFYLPGQFDPSLEQYAAQTLAEALRTMVPQEGGAESATPETVPAGSAATDSPAEDAACPAQSIGTGWLQALDRALEQRDTQGFVDLFAAGVRITARTRLDSGEIVETQLNRQELVQSTLSSLSQLSAFQSQRPQVAVRVLDAGPCRRLELRSSVVERGTSAGRNYQLESQERYELQWENGVWRATVAETSQNE